MGTKVEGKTYIPGYFDMADSSVNSNGNVLSCQKENKVHLSDHFTVISSSGSVHYDKEMLKRTMLVHEATFRKQVYELHHLYKIQKDLMAQFQSEEFNGFPRYADALQPWSSVSQSLLADVKGVWQTGTSTSGHDLKQSSIDFMNESSSQYKVRGASFKHNNVRSGKKLLDLQLPADVYADDDDVEILDEKPSRNLLGANGSAFGGNVKHNLENSEGSSHVEKSCITNIQAHHSSAARVPNKPVEESSNMKITDFLGVGISSSQKQHYVSQGVNLNLLSLEGNLKEKYSDEISHSRSFNANDEIRDNKSFGQRKDDSNTNSSMSWLKYKQNFTNSSMGHYLPNASTFNHFLLAPAGFNLAVNSPWQSNNTTFLDKGQYGTVETSAAKHSLSNGISMESNPKIPYRHPLKIDGEPEKLPPPHDYLKGIDLNDAPVDTTANWEQGSENSVIDISRFRKNSLNLIKSQVQSSCAEDHSQGLVSPTLYSEGRTRTRVPGFPISAFAEKDSRCSHTLKYDLNIGPSEHEADMEMQPQSKEADTNIKNFIDLNEALPIVDAPEMDVQKSEADNVHHKHKDPSRDSVAITAAESLVAMCNAVQPGSPQLDALHWFAELAISKNTMSGDDSDSQEDFEALTLKLQETESYEYHSAPRTQEDNSNDDHFSAASLLVSKSRRGKGRGRRQRKDFQKDILPGLASLSKHEVSKDLYALGKQVTPTRRRGRNGQPPRGRRQAKNMAVAIEEAEVSPPRAPPPPPLAPADLDSDALGMTRWGRTIRRCRRPRYPPANKDSLCLA